jgi:hypothetical protein
MDVRRQNPIEAARYPRFSASQWNDYGQNNCSLVWLNEKGVLMDNRDLNGGDQGDDSERRSYRLALQRFQNVVMDLDDDVEYSDHNECD